MLISAIEHQPTSQNYFDNLFPNIELTWKKICLNAGKATANSHLRFFNFKIINNLLYLNKKIFLNILQNHILLIFKVYVYQSRERGVLNLNSLIKNVTKVKKIERKIASVYEKKTIQLNNKWRSTVLKITI